MKIAKVIGTVTLHGAESALVPGKLLICDVLDAGGVLKSDEWVTRRVELGESYVVYDRLGAGVGSVIAVSESGEATRPFLPKRVPVDAYCAAILDRINVDERYLDAGDLAHAAGAKA